MPHGNLGEIEGPGVSNSLILLVHVFEEGSGSRHVEGERLRVHIDTLKRAKERVAWREVEKETFSDWEVEKSLLLFDSHQWLVLSSSGFIEEYQAALRCSGESHSIDLSEETQEEGE